MARTKADIGITCEVHTRQQTSGGPTCTHDGCAYASKFLVAGLRSIWASLLKPARTTKMPVPRMPSMKYSTLGMVRHESACSARKASKSRSTLPAVQYSSKGILYELISNLPAQAGIMRRWWSSNVVAPISSRVPFHLDIS